jgi:peptide/nickel transport system substrate-binding protein
MKRRDFAINSVAAASLATLPLASLAQKRKDAVVLGMTLEPTGLDPTAGAASAIAEIVQYNVFETLTKVNSDGSVTPLLAESWEVSPDLKTYTFKLRKGVKFQNGEPFNANTVKFSFERAAGEKSTNKDKRTFASMERVGVVDEHTVVVINKELNPDFLFLMGQATAILVEPKSADTNATKPVGTGPYKLESWNKGASVTLAKWPEYRNAAAIKMNKATFRFISDPAAQVAALLSGDLDMFSRVGAARSLEQFKRDPRFQIIISGSRAKTILAINNKKKASRRRAGAPRHCGGHRPQGRNRRRRRRIRCAHRQPLRARRIRLCGHHRHQPLQPRQGARPVVRGRRQDTLELNLVLPPVPYARQGGEVIAAQLAKVGIVAKLQNVEWAQWLSGVYGNKNYDLTIISHVEPFDLGNFTKSGYYWNYESPKFNEIYDKINNAPRAADRAKLLGDAQRMLANDAVHAFLFQPQWITVAQKGIRGLWKDMPLFVNDIGALSWS